MSENRIMELEAEQLNQESGATIFDQQDNEPEAAVFDQSQEPDAGEIVVSLYDQYWTTIQPVLQKLRDITELTGQITGNVYELRDMYDKELKNLSTGRKKPRKIGYMSLEITGYIGCLIGEVDKAARDASEMILKALIGRSGGRA